MKKFFLSAGLVILFTAYVIYQHMQGSHHLLALPSVGSDKLNTAPPSVSVKNYRDGVYTGKSEDAYYGNVEVEVTIKDGRISDVKVLDFPQDRKTSEQINGLAVPQLVYEALQVQSAGVDVVSGATQTSKAFIRSMETALSQAS